MTHLSYDDMNQMIVDGSAAFDYAWEHYDELCNRKATYTLYGPKADFLGAASPCHLISNAQRCLTISTRRKAYTVYELDENFQVLRVKKMKNHRETDCVYHLFKLEETIYARSFWGGEKRAYSKSVESIRFFNGRPILYAHILPNQLYAEVYEHTADGGTDGFAYLYRPNGTVTVCGVPVSWDAPFGSPASPVSCTRFESAPQYIDFANWF